MGSFLRKHPVAVLLSIGLHAVLAAVLIVGVDFGGRSRVPLPAAEQVALEATVVDEALIQQEMERLEQQEQAEILRQQEQERLAREQAEAARRQREEEERQLEAARREREAAALIEQERLAELQRQRDEQEQLRQEAERQRVEEEARLARVREEQERRRREEEERLRAEEERRRQEAAAAAAQRAEMEAELQRALAVEDERRRAEQAGLLDEYIRLIENRIQQNWIPPASARAGLECIVNVTQIPSGDVIDVRIGRCNGDEAVVRSIEAAVLRASPLPKPPIPSLFERNLEVVFNPEV
jgi:colicin import membrane protein